MTTPKKLAETLAQRDNRQERPFLLDKHPEAKEFVDACVEHIAKGAVIPIATIARTAQRELGYPGSTSSIRSYIYSKYGTLGELRGKE